MSQVMTFDFTPSLLLPVEFGELIRKIDQSMVTIDIFRGVLYAAERRELSLHL